MWWLFFMPCPQYDVTCHLICISLEPLLILKGLSRFWFSFYRRFKKKDTLILTQENFLKPGRGWVSYDDEGWPCPECRTRILPKLRKYLCCIHIATFVWQVYLPFYSHEFLGQGMQNKFFVTVFQHNLHRRIKHISNSDGKIHFFIMEIRLIKLANEGS